jgi:hypothetical protein
MAPWLRNIFEIGSGVVVFLVLIVQFADCSFKRAGKKVLVLVPEKEYIVPRNKIENGDTLEGARESYRIKLLDELLSQVLLIASRTT